MAETNQSVSSRLDDLSPAELRQLVVQLESDLEAERLTHHAHVGDDDDDSGMLVRVEQQYSLLQAENRALAERYDAVLSENKQLLQQHDVDRGDMTRLSHEVSQHGVVVMQLRGTVETLESQNTNLLTNIDRLQTHVDRLHSSNLEYTDRIVQLSQHAQHSELMCAEARGRVEPLQIKAAHYEAELELCRGQLNDARQEVTALSSKLSESESLHQSLQRDHETSESVVSEVRSGYEKHIELLRQQVRQATQAVDTAQRDLLHQQTSHQAELQRVESELSTQQKLAELMRQSRDNEQQRVTELTQALEQSKQQLSADGAAHEHALQLQLSRIDSLTVELQSVTDQVSKLQSENSTLTRQVENLQQMQKDEATYPLLPPITDAAVQSLPGYAGM